VNTELVHIAQNLARNCGYSVFPCHSAPGNKDVDKKPATLHGFKDAVRDPDAVADLWRRCPGPLIGIATGKASGISVLDVDVAHDTARAWWAQHETRIPTTRIYRTRSGGLHLYFRHATGVGTIAGKPVKGVDVRGEGGYVIFWSAISCHCGRNVLGFDCMDNAPVAPWPDWLTAFFWPPKPEFRKAPSSSGSFGLPGNTSSPGANGSATIEGLIRTVREATEGTRNGKLNWAAYHLHKHVAAGEISEAEAKYDILEAARHAGLSEREAARTIASAWSAA
jgi:hypothetical protein